MMYAVYSNPGTLDIRAVTVLGLNAKPATDSPIGYFGTGMKYAVAIALRHGFEMTIQDGAGNTFTPRIEQIDFRGKPAQQCFLADQHGTLTQLPFTTEYGKDWKLWELHRELECNARDEGGAFTIMEKYPNQHKGLVQIVIANRFFTEAVKAERETIFFELGDKGKLISTGTAVTVKSGGSPFAYYRGMRAFTAPTNKYFAFTYNLKSSHVLTENRTLRDPYVIGLVVRNLLQTETEYAKTLILAPDAYEWQVVGWIFELPDPILNWCRGIAGSGTKLPALVEQQMWQQLARRDLDCPIKGTSGQQKMLKEAIELLKPAGYSGITNFPIKIARSLPGNVLGLAQRSGGENTIFICERAFRMGFETVAAVLLEEFLHLDKLLDDNSREMQSYLLHEIVFLLKTMRTLAAGQDTAKMMRAFHENYTITKESNDEIPF